MSQEWGRADAAGTWPRPKPVWTFALLRPVREAGAVRAGRAMGTRPRIFENR